MCCAVLSCFNHVWVFATLWTVARQAPLSMGFSRQEYWSGLPCPPPGDLPNPGIQPVTPAGRFFTAEPPGKPITWIYHSLFCIHQLMSVWVAPSLAIMHKCCYEHLCASFCMFLYVCITLRCIARSKIDLSYGKFSKVLQHFTFPFTSLLAMYECCSFYIWVNTCYLSIYLAICLPSFLPFCYSHCSRCELVSYCGFDLHFLLD